MTMRRVRRRSRARKRFRQLPLPARIGLGMLGAVEVVLLVAAEADIQRRPADQVAGRKLWWRAISLINIVGPLSYFRWGRRQHADPRPPSPVQLTAEP